MNQISVVGAIIRAGLVLCAQRGVPGALPGMWEFPGGKIEPGETPRSALEREITEELLCSVRIGRSSPKGASGVARRSEEHTSELQSLMRISSAVFCLTKKH